MSSKLDDITEAQPDQPCTQTEIPSGSGERGARFGIEDRCKRNRVVFAQDGTHIDNERSKDHLWFREDNRGYLLEMLVASPSKRTEVVCQKIQARHAEREKKSSEPWKSTILNRKVEKKGARGKDWKKLKEGVEMFCGRRQV